MPLTAQERRCIELALPLLGQLYGGSWMVPDGPTLDELYEAQASPECLATNGSISAAIEVKALTGGEVERAYKEALASLPKALDPRCDGFYVLGPATAFHVPVDQPLLRHLRKEVRRVAPKLARGETGGVRLPRKAWVSLDSEHGRGRVHCCHNYSEHLFEGLGSEITGSLMLVDDHLPDHSFVTAEALAAFRAELIAACYRRTHGGSNHFEWYEEIPLLRCDEEDDDERGLDVLAVTEAYHVDASVAEALDLMLEKAVKKFDQKWSERHVIVFDKATGLCNAERVRLALSWVTPEEVANVDLVLLTDNDEVSVVWRNDARH